MFPALLFRFATRRTIPLLAAFSASLASVFAQAPGALDGFAPDVDGNVFAVATQSDGKIVVGGLFATVQSSNRRNLARLNPDGSLDESFNPGANGPVRAIAIQSDGQIVIGGDFTSLQPGGAGASVGRNRIARLNADGTVDARFNPNLGGERQPQVHALLLQPDGRIVVGGSFTTVGAGTTRNRLARFNPDGTLDASFDPSPNGMVLALALHVDGKILAGGGFTAFQRPTDSAPTGRNRIARLNPNGSVDASFDADANNAVAALAVQRDGKILLGGNFTTVHPIGDENATARARLARLMRDGTLDYDFVANVNGAVATVAIQPDGGILVGGSFNTAWGRGGASGTRNNIARFFADGTLDSQFSPNVNAQVDAIAVQPDGKIVLGGYFTRVQPRGSISSVVRNRLARLNADGSVDASFELDPGGRVLVSAVQSDGKILVGGGFRNIGGATRDYFARLNADGSVDAAYRPVLNDRVYTVALQADGRAIVGGAFTTVNGETRNYVARLNPDGSLDSGFNPNVNGTVGIVLVQSDGRVLVGGTFTNVQPAGAGTSTLRLNLARFNADGSLDTAFDPAPNSSVAALALQPDGKILLGGSFSAFTPSSGSAAGRNFFARINADGTLDATFTAALNGRVSAIVVQSDGKIVVGGAFTSALGGGATEQVTRNRIARFNADGTVDAAFDPNANDNVLALALQSDGKLVVGGAFTTLQPPGASDWILRKYAVRLNADGSVDPAFNLDLDERAGNRVDSLRFQSNGRLLIGGAFTTLHPAGTATRVTRSAFARLNADGTVDPTFTLGAGAVSRGEIHALALQPDHKIVAVGAFADLGGARTANIARFNPEGGADATFSPTVAANGPVHAVAIRPESALTLSQAPGFAWLNRNGTLRTFNVRGASRLSGNIFVAAVHANGGVYLGGAFTNLANTTGGNLVRLNADGSLDPNFSPAPNGAVTSMAVQSDGRIVIAGSFTVVHGAVRNRIARLNADGTLDAGFDPNASLAINALAIEADGRMIVGGAFTTFTPNATTTAVARNFLARLNSDGTVDANYNPNPNALVHAIVAAGDGRVIIGGGFTGLQPGTATTVTTRNGVARLNADGTVDPNFDPNMNGTVYALAVQPNGQVVIGGAFTTVGGGDAPYLARNNIARVNSNGIGDQVFNPNVNGTVRALAVQSDGGVLLAGDFTTIQANDAAAPVARNGLARVNSNGSLDIDFDPALNGPVLGLAARPDGTILVTGGFTGLQGSGSILIGGDFSTVGGIARQNLAALTTDGSVSASFRPNPDGAVNALLAQPDGKALAGGAFATIAGASRNGLARFNSDGSLDAGFAPALGGTVNALALQSDGKVLVGGAFGAAPGLVRLNADGSIDSTFTAVAASPVTSVAVHRTGIIVYVTGESTLGALNPDGSAAPIPPAQADGGFKTLVLDADGGLIVGGSAAISGVGRSFIGRYTLTGGIDESFAPQVNGAVTAIAIQSDGRIMIGGNFTTVDGQPRFGLARVAAPTAPIDVLGVLADGRSIKWVRGGSAAEVAAVLFERSTDRTTWTSLGSGMPAADGWTLSGVTLPESGVFYIRARAIVPSSGGRASGGLELVREFNLAAGEFAPVAAGPMTAEGVTYNMYTGVYGGPGSNGAIPPGAASLITAGGDTIEIIAANLQRGSGTGQLANLSTRARVTADNPLILGFAVTGTEPRPLLLRAVGPALAGFGVGEALAETQLQIYDSAGGLIAANNGWSGAADVAQAAAHTGAFPLAEGSADSAAVVTLHPGVYTMQVVDPRGTGGVALAEIYDAGTGGASRLVNVSSRGAAGSGGDALISGFVISGDAPKRVLLRGVGPTLSQFGALDVVADPSIALYDSAGVQFGTNDNWVGVTPVIAAATSGGAFPLAPCSKDAAVIATLPPGTYTIQVRAAEGSGRTALLEVYELQ